MATPPSSSANSAPAVINADAAMPTVNANLIDPRTTPVIVSFNVAAQAPLKLTASNYLSWCLQFITLLTVYALLGFVDGTIICPVKTITVNGADTANLAHHTWVRQDQLISNAIIGSLSPTLIPFIATARTSRDAWSTLALTYGKPTRGRITQLKTQLNHPIKGS